jgi:hypothetical protein
MSEPFSARRVACIACVALAGCGAKGAGGLGEVGTYPPDMPSFPGGDGGGPGPLDAQIEQNSIAVKVVTVSCAGSCAEIEAVPTGGNPPYTFAWENGSTGAARQVCPTAGASYSVTVSDTGATGEIARPSQSTTVAVTSDILACPDAAGSPSCAMNLSFEGTPNPNPDANTNPDIGAPPWVACPPSAGAAVNAGIIASNYVSPVLQMFPAAADGSTYLDLVGLGPGYIVYGPTADNQNGVVWAPLCEPFHAGTTYSFTVELASDANLQGIGKEQLQILGGTSACSKGQVLWTSPVSTPSWSTFCATFTPTVETTYLGLEGVVPSSAGATTGNLLVDHMVPVASCP